MPPGSVMTVCLPRCGSSDSFHNVQNSAPCLIHLVRPITSPSRTRQPFDGSMGEFRIRHISGITWNLLAWADILRSNKCCIDLIEVSVQMCVLLWSNKNKKSSF